MYILLNWKACVKLTYFFSVPCLLRYCHNIFREFPIYYGFNFFKRLDKKNKMTYLIYVYTIIYQFATINILIYKKIYSPDIGTISFS